MKKLSKEEKLILIEAKKILEAMGDPEEFMEEVFWLYSDDELQTPVESGEWHVCGSCGEESWVEDSTYSNCVWCGQT